MPCFFIRCFVLFLIPLCVLAQSNGNISIGSRLTAGDVNGNPWLSPSGDFAFGFKKLQDDDHFLLSIWYDKIPDKTVVWHANVSSPVPRGSRVELDANFGLVLRNPQEELVWSSDDIFGDVAYGFLNDTGNFVLISESENTSIWESFGNPTDTMLPSQELEIGGMLISRRSESNFSQGRFYLRMLDDGNLVISMKSVPTYTDFDDDAYYNSLTNDAVNSSNSGLKLVLDELGSTFILRKNGKSEKLTSSSSSTPPTSDYYHRLTLGFDGVLSQYYHPRRSSSNNQSWTMLWSQPENVCSSFSRGTGSGACGYNSICSLDNGKKRCECPRGYSLLDPSDEFGSCIPNHSQSCYAAEKGLAEDLYDFVTLTNTDWPFSDFDKMRPSSEEECRNACLHDCLCAVAIYRDNSCWKKKLPLSNGKIDNSLNSKAFLKYRKREEAPLLDPMPPVSEESKRKNDRTTLILAGSVLLGSSVFINILLVIAGCLGFFLIYKKKITKLFPGNNSLETNLRCFTFRELEEATNGFKEELGRGAFGIVYKGFIRSGSETIVAVKKLDRMARDNDKEFRTEVQVIGQTHHKNLVRLIGFCDQEKNRLLVYEYMSNGTLASFLFGDQKPSWSHRIKIAQGIAWGLTYLHEECSTQIIHCDIKPQNILLDEYYTARVSDFGLVKTLMIDQSRTNTGIRGTKGYLAPEWFRNTKINFKVDVYSFGVLLLEIITCRKSLEDMEMEAGEGAILTDWAWDCFQEGELDRLVRDDMEAMNDRKRLERLVMVGIWCIQEDSSFRPTMRKVSQMLEGDVEVTKPPCPYIFTSTNS